MNRIDTYLDLNHARTKKIVLVGVGSIGSSHALLLSKLGFNNLTLIDRDIILEENLSTQVLYTEKDINQPKVEACKSALLKFNPDLKIKPIFDHLDFKNITKHFKDADLILDGTDNLSTRFLIDEWCKKNNKTWIFSSVIKEQGFCMVLNQDQHLSSFLNDKANPKTCSELGVLTPTITFISSFTISQAIKVLLNKDYDSSLFYFDLKSNKFNKMSIPHISQTYGYLSCKNTPKIKTLCGKKEFLIYKKNPTSTLKHSKHFTDFGDKVIIRANNLKQAKARFNEFIGEI